MNLPSYAFYRYLLVDSFAIYEALITAVIFLLASFYSRGYVRSLLEEGEIKGRELRLFYIAFNLLLAVVTFAFYSNNLALFWILLELTTVISAVLIVTLNAKENILAALKYIFTASTAMLFSIVGLIILFAITKQAAGTGTLNWDELMTLGARSARSAVHFRFYLYFHRFRCQGRHRAFSYVAAPGPCQSPFRYQRPCSPLSC